WLAFAWKNWLLACERCNSGWKRTLFPVREDANLGRALETVYRLGGMAGGETLLSEQAAPPPKPTPKNSTHVLSPFGPEDPVEHLAFTTIGQIAPRDGSEHGRETIRTCGLHRESLRRARQGIAMDVFRHIERLIRALADHDHDKSRAAIEDLL